MKPLLAAPALLAFLAALLAGPAWAGPRDGDRHDGRRQHHERQEPPSPDLDGDGRLSTYERIRQQQQERWNRLMDAQR